MISGFGPFEQASLSSAESGIPADIAPLMELLHAGRRAVDLTDMGASFDAIIRRLGFGDFSLRLKRPAPPGETSYDGIWTYPTSWESHFQASRYYLISPVFHLADRLHRPFNWFEVLALPNLTKRSRQIFYEAAEFSIGMGLTVPLHPTHDLPAVFTITSDRQADPSADSIRVQGRMAHLLGLGFYELAAPLLHNRQLALRDAGPTVAAANDNFPAGRHGTAREFRHALTSIERECLTWCAAGFDSQAISERLWLSDALVHRILELARIKLGVTTREHAVVRALANDLIAI